MELQEAKYKDKEVTLNKPFRLSGEQKTGQKTHGVYVKNPETGNVVLVKFGHDMPNRNDEPERKKAFDSRHNCDEKKDITSPGHWSCKSWESYRETDSENIVKINIPTITRLFEYMKEDVKDDIEIHIILERLVEMSINNNIINMSHYDYIINGKMELKEEITQLEKQLEAMDNNPIEKNPENKRNKGTTLKMDNIPEDKECNDKIEDKKDKFVKFESLQKELSSTIKEFNNNPTMKEAKIFIDDPFEAPPGANVQVGPRGGYFYDTSPTKSDDKKGKDKDVTKDMSSSKDLAKSK
ncbi:MAG: hypothetical protein EOM19_03995 [Candidatus Moranbacteria bacterium]|nr:hypothetical protein [Candidatus Moranbacteria bacterium]